MSASEPTFTRDEIRRYFNHIGLPQKYHSILDSPAPQLLDIRLLTALHVHQLAAIPYENLSLHYSTTKTISLDPRDCYAKFIDKACNRGGYCMENTLFFLHVLRSLGYDVYPTGVRIRLRKDGVPSGPYVGLVHIVLIITLADGGKYVCDMAFGGDGPTRPLPLVAGQVMQNLGKQEVRLMYEPIPEVRARASGTRNSFWVYQYRNGKEQAWNSFYCFSETEFLEQDFGVMNFFTSQGKTFQKVMVLVIRFLKGEEEEQESKITGKLMMVNGTLKRNLGGKTEVVRECITEDERVETLKEWFGIDLSEDEKAAIRGEVTELRDVEIVGA